MKCLVSWLSLLGVLAGTVVAADVATPSRPNVLLVIADDCTHSDLRIYGGRNAMTPNIDRLATEGLVFNRCYLAEAMCQPCRSELYSGQYPLRNGAAWNHSASRSATTSLPQYLTPAGYRVGLAGKSHVRPQTAFPFEKVAGFDDNCTRNPTQPHDTQPILDFMTRDKSQPFCLVVALVEPHVPWVMGDPSKYPPKKIDLPPNIADTPRTRADFGKYLAEITYMDGQVGDILKALEKSGQAGNTLVLFTSEQGAQFPGCKWTNWDSGLHTALIARWPGHTPTGSRTDALVQYADVAPTIMEVAAADGASYRLDGTSFRGVLEGKTDKHRRYTYGLHNNLPEGPAYPIRSVCDGEYHYVRNLTPTEIYIERHVMGVSGDGSLNNPYWATWVWAASDSSQVYKLVKRYTVRPAEELYQLSADRFEMNNLADDPKYTEIKARLSAELDQWMKSQGDPGKAEDTPEALKAAREGKHLYYPPQ